MKKTSMLFIGTAVILAAGCKSKNGAVENITISPKPGVLSTNDKPLAFNVSYEKSYSPDSVVYYLDSIRVGVRKDSSVISIKTDTLHMGKRDVTAKVYKDGKIQNVQTSFLKMPKYAPEQWTYTVVKQFPHDSTANTEGLSYEDGFLYETTGDSTKASELRKVDITTGKVVLSQKVDKHYLKGNTIVGDKIIAFAQNDTAGFVFDKNTLKLLSRFNPKAANANWGAAFDGSKIYVSDGNNRIWLLDKNNYKNRGYIDAFDNQRPLPPINELEYIDGKIYANIYGYDTFVVIDPKTGSVDRALNMVNIFPYEERPKRFDAKENVLNGIAYDAKGKRVFVTGKRWPHVYQIDVVRGLPASLMKFLKKKKKS
ncbi:glutaminyl-peptide cyclotransferase [Mucilaginibacter corticis]|uniref:Glutaminyl-peptide cyclotransferase n=1 Tax=Mucilaginibacter corticis TaxID=2597670 RepID=A0A556MWR5_9SPHI|nr:glutaminyl-peptide cyclotransferase [Mucilaginibacter corticis]TSJ44322.1 glutaminyl-peptide cyclotransferase [Mucilaginibacter corticis]